jgi:hypothetical protein
VKQTGIDSLLAGCFFWLVLTVAGTVLGTVFGFAVVMGVHAHPVIVLVGSVVGLVGGAAFAALTVGLRGGSSGASRD